MIRELTIDEYEALPPTKREAAYVVNCTHNKETVLQALGSVLITYNGIMRRERETGWVCTDQACARVHEDEVEMCKTCAKPVAKTTVWGKCYLVKDEVFPMDTLTVEQLLRTFAKSLTTRIDPALFLDAKTPRDAATILAPKKVGKTPETDQQKIAKAVNNKSTDEIADLLRLVLSGDKAADILRRLVEGQSE